MIAEASPNRDKRNRLSIPDNKQIGRGTRERSLVENEYLVRPDGRQTSGCGQYTARAAGSGEGVGLFGMRKTFDY